MSVNAGQATVSAMVADFSTWFSKPPIPEKQFVHGQFSFWEGTIVCWNEWTAEVSLVFRKAIVQKLSHKRKSHVVIGLTADVASGNFIQDVEFPAHEQVQVFHSKWRDVLFGG